MTRSSQKKVLESIYSVLTENESKNISQISIESKIPNITIKKYLDLIEFIQSQPKLILERTGHSYQAKIEQKK